MSPLGLHRSSLPDVSATSAPLPLADDAAWRATVRLDRAQLELKHGRELVLQPEDESAPLLLVAAVETLSAERLATLDTWGHPLRLLLTGERMQSLGGTAAPAALRCPPNVGLQTLQHWAAVSADVLDPQALRDAAPTGPAMDAALRIAKRARLTPALVAAELPRSLAPRLAAAEILVLPVADAERLLEAATLRLQRVSDARVPIAAREDCTLVLFREVGGGTEHVAVVFGTLDTQRPVPVRLHSSCLTGDLLGSLRCDCGDQLGRAVSQLAQCGGVLLYLSQEGRGTGLANKLRAYRLQDGGLDTIDADRHLGFRDDERDYPAAVAMLQALGITRIELLTNNPRKIAALQAGGIEVAARVALTAPTNVHNARYVHTKRHRAGHLGSDNAPLDGQ
ncbi:GTP cyclohydrolase II RibA [Aquincola sp. MAHUQ-54]|uniref:GTP cyclohydrolase-2 n=1 Tax=Aquincola agrisoli TaxID=3119538 RepID=A0AAW9QMD2_9BURK